MPISRSDVLGALSFCLTGKVTQEKIYEWALSQAVAKDYDGIAGADPLLKESVQALIDMSNPGPGYAPTREDLVYYLRCLEGAASFEPLAVRLEKAQAKEREKDRGRRQRVISVSREQYILWMRIYVVLFAAGSFLINTVWIFKPEFFDVETKRSFLENFADALPQLVYSGTLLLPPGVMVRGWPFYIYFSIFVAGMLAYWAATVSVVMGLGLHPYLLLVFAPFGGIPPAIAVWLLWQKRKEFLKSLK